MNGAARAPRPTGAGTLAPAKRHPAERWLSGRKHRTRNAAYGQPYRGFESHPLRHIPELKLIFTSVWQFGCMDQSVDPNRRSRRSPVFLKASIEVDGNPVPVTLRNLSEQGALIEGDCLPPAGTDTRFHRNNLRVKGCIAWVHDRFAGIAFDQELKREDVLRHVPNAPRHVVPQHVKRPGLATQPLSEAERKLLHAWMTEGKVARPGD